MLDILWVVICSGLVFLMQAGFMCLESGLTRTKNNINVAVKNLLDFAVSVALFWIFGYGLMFGASQLGWFGLGSILPHINTTPETAVFFLFQAMFCGTATTIISGALAERLNFNSYLIIAAFVSGLIYPMFGHWAWNGLLEGNSGGWLEAIGFVDFAGSTVVHSTGAWVSLAALQLVGARQGRFTKGAVNKIQGSNMPFSVLGALLLWFGWIGFNGGSTLALNEQVPGIVLNTMLAGVMGLLTAATLSGIQHKRVEVELIINGSIAGLVAITACCHVVTTPMAAVVGVTGAGVAFLVEYWMVRSRLDDAVGAVAVHGGAGIWGTLCVALFGQMSVLETGLNRGSQLFVQLLGTGVCFLWAFGMSWAALWLLNQVMPLRVSDKAEIVGLNISEHHAKTDTYDLFQVMDQQAQTQDLSLRVPVEPYTEVGHIATRYNQVMANLERQHQQQVDDLEHIYHLVAIASSALDTHTFDINDSELEELSERQDDLGHLARVFQQLLHEVNSREELLNGVWAGLSPLDPSIQKQILLQALTTRFGSLPDHIGSDIEQQLTQGDHATTLAEVWKRLVQQVETKLTDHQNSARDTSVELLR
ncbi:MAG: ammonium transporter [Merismopedia sp. SIO2A8]|nr:ammonium transporter [Symploca sp. SIO2B6]NET48336.1 ammonium transporter [Merismopedia sp. SIO2A8]